MIPTKIAVAESFRPPLSMPLDCLFPLAQHLLVAAVPPLALLLPLAVSDFIVAAEATIVVPSASISVAAAGAAAMPLSAADDDELRVGGDALSTVCARLKREDEKDIFEWRCSRWWWLQ